MSTKYRVANRTVRNIWVKDGSSSYAEIPPGRDLEIAASSDRDCTIWGKYGERPNQRDEEMGALWIPREGKVTVYNRWNWEIRPSKSVGEDFPGALGETAAVQDDTSNLPLEVEQKADNIYGVINRTGRNIWVLDHTWSSGLIVPKEHRRIIAHADVNVTIWGKYGEPPNERDVKMTALWIPRRGQVIVYDKWSSDIQPLFVRGPGKQSPVALSESAAEYEKSSLQIRWKKDLAGRVVRHGNHVKVEFTDADRGYFKVNDDKEWTIEEFHLHASAEHPIEGKYAPIELHIVHKNARDNSLAVIGITFEESSSLSESEGGFFADLNERWAALKDGNVVDMPVRPYDLLPGDHSEYYYYDGSLTTEPFGEDVSWFVLRNPKLLPAETIDEYKKNYSGTPRDIQPLNYRYLYRNF